MVQHKLPAIAISRVQLLQHPPPCPGPSHTERNLSSLSFSLRNLLATCSSSLRGWKGQAPALSHVHRGLAWHRATLVTGEVALLAGAQNCFLWIFLPPSTDLRLLCSLLNATHHSLLWDRMPCVNIRDCKMGEKIAYQQIWLNLPNQPMQRLFVDWRGLVYAEAQNIPEPLFTSLVLCSPARYPALLIRLEHHSWIRQTDWSYSIYKTNTVTSVIPDVQT